MKLLQGCLLAAAVMLLPARAAAQVPGDTAAQVVVDRTPSMIAGGLLGGTLGLFVGGAAGAAFERSATDSCYDWCGFGGALLGGLIGESLGMALGVHYANDRQGSLGAAFRGPAMVGAGGILLAMSGADYVPPIVIVVAIPTAQLMAAIAGEKAAARKNATRR